MLGAASNDGPSVRAWSIAPVRRAMEWAHASAVLALQGALRAEGGFRR
jgi:hypothetical protein